MRMWGPAGYLELMRGSARNLTYMYLAVLSAISNVYPRRSLSLGMIAEHHRTIAYLLAAAEVQFSVSGNSAFRDTTQRLLAPEHDTVCDLTPLPWSS